MIHVAEIRDAAGLADIKLLWESLWQRTRGASFLQSFDCFETYCKHFGQTDQMKVLIATLAAKPIGILPFVVRKSETVFGSVRALTYPMGNLGIGYGPIGPNRAATLAAVMRHLRDNRHGWDVIDLRQVGLNRLDRGRTRNALRAAGMNHASQPDRTASIVEFNKNWAGYWSSRSLESRRRFHRSERRLSQLGELNLVRIRPGERRYGDIGSGRKMVDQMFQPGSSAVVKSPADRELLREIDTLAVRHAAVDASLLQLDGESIAAAYGYRVGGRVEIMGLDAGPEFGDDACRVLSARMLRDGASRGDESYWFSPHLLPLVSEWQTDAIQTERLTHFAPTAPKAQLLRWNRNVQNWWGSLRQLTAALNL